MCTTIYKIPSNISTLRSTKRKKYTLSYHLAETIEKTIVIAIGLDIITASCVDSLFVNLEI